jgi:hypothetical protein
MTDMDLFSDMTAEETPEPETDENPTEDETETQESDETDESTDENQEPEATVSEIPAGAVSVTDFAKTLTFLPDNPYGYVVPQAVYQAARAKKNPLPHVLVKTEDDNQPRLYILEKEALAQWADRASRNEGRGTGTGKPASKRSADELREALTKENGAVWNLCYAISRRDLWDAAVADRQKTVEKYHRWMTEAGITPDEFADLLAAAKRTFDEAEQAKVEEREAKKAENKAARDAQKNGNGTTE